MAEEKSTTTDKKPVYKKWWFWVIVVIVIIGIYGQGKNNGTKVGENNNNSSNTTQKEIKKDFVVGDVISLKGEEVTLKSVERNYNTGNQYNTPKKGKEFVKVNLLIENKDNDNLSYNALDWKMQDSNGAMESYAFIADDDGHLGSGDLIKGGKKTGSLVFEVPKDDKGLVLHYKPSYFSNDEVKIKL